MSDEGTRWLLQVWREGDLVMVKADTTVDVAIAVTHAARVLADDPGVPPDVRKAAGALVEVLLNGAPPTPMLYPKKSGRGPE